LDAAALTFIETLLRIGLGLRFLYSGVSNVRRWPNPVRNAAIVFPFGTKFFGAIAVFLLIGGGVGLIFGVATRVAAAMIALFLLPTLKIQAYWLKVLPPMIEEIRSGMAETVQPKFQLVARHAYHSHEAGWQTNLLLLLLALYFVIRGPVGLGLDNFFSPR
jgi:uncharacterized membrane protein YphA (DoxX/SURF4 family)